MHIGHNHGGGGGGGGAAYNADSLNPAGVAGAVVKSAFAANEPIDEQALFQFKVKAFFVMLVIAFVGGMLPLKARDMERVRLLYLFCIFVIFVLFFVNVDDIFVIL